MKDILAIITPVDANVPGQATSYALALARLVGAHVTALITDIESAPPSAGTLKPDLMQGSSELAEQLPAKARLARTIELVQGAAKRAKVTYTVLAEPHSSTLRERLIGIAQVCDVVIFDVCGSLRDPRQGLVKAVLFGSGRPIIVVPPCVHAPAVERALIAWDGTRSAARALHDALPVLTHMREVVVATVADEKELRNPGSGDEVCRYLGRWGVQARFELLQRGSRDVGDVLLGHAAEIEADLVVMGGFAHGMERQLLFGSATRDVLESIPDIPVLLSH